MKRLVAFRVDHGGSVLVWRSQPASCKEFYMVPQSAVPEIIRLVDSHVTN
jgi:hypothetical protein